MTDTIMIIDGSILEGVHCIQQPDIGDGGVITMVPVTRLNDGDVKKVLGQFNEPFEDEFYFWQCYEMVRRMMQTGVVVLMFMAFGRTVGLMYALVFSILAVVLHDRYSPYKNDALDSLQLTILVNQLLIQLMVVYLEMTESYALVIGVFVILVQMLLIAYGMTLIVPAFRPAMTQLSKKAYAALYLIYQRRLETSKGLKFKTASSQQLGRSESSAASIQEELTIESGTSLRPRGDDATNQIASEVAIHNPMCKTEGHPSDVLVSNPTYIGVVFHDDVDKHKSQHRCSNTTEIDVVP